MRKLIFFLFFCLPAQAANYYVSTTGSDSHGCSTTDSAATNKLTILGGYGCLANGDTLLVHAGTYSPFILSTGGIAGSPKTIKAFSGESPIIRDASNQNVFNGNGVNTIFLYTGANYLVLDGLTVQRGENALTVYGHHNVIQNCIVTEGWESGILVYYVNANNNIVQNCIIYNNNQDNWPRGSIAQHGSAWGSALNAAEGAKNNIFQDNYVYWNHGEGINVWSVSQGGTDGNIVRRNVVADNWSVNIYDAGGSNTVIDSNIVWNTDAARNWPVGGVDNNPAGIGAAIETTLASLTGTKIVNNIVINTRGGLFAFSQNSGKPYSGWIIENNDFIRNDNGLYIHNSSLSVTNMIISNNIILQGSSGYIVTILPTPSSNTFKNNLYSGSAGSPYQYGTTSYNYSGWLSATGETGSLNTSPMLVASSNNPPQLWTDPITPPSLPLPTRIALSADYALQTASPAKDTGFTTSNVTLDLAGYGRPQGAAYDIGALEVLGSIPPPLSTISMSYPNGGESFRIGTPINILWASNDNHTVKLEVSHDGGSTYSEVIVEGLSQVADSTNSYSWTPTAPRTTLAKIRVTNLFDLVADESNASFAIHGRYIK